MKENIRFMMNIILRFLFCFIYLSVNENSGEKTERRKAMKVSVPGAVSEDQIGHDGNKKTGMPRQKTPDKIQYCANKQLKEGITTFYEKASVMPYAPDFSFMDEYRGRLGVTAYDLLHGYCNVFAKALNMEFGYRTFRIVDEYGTLIHCYARTEEAGKTVYVDVRGKTSDYSAFISEFEDWTTEEDSMKNTMVLDPEGVYVAQMTHTEAAYDLSMEMLERFRGQYKAA